MVDTSAQVRRVIEYAQVEVDISEDQARLLQTAAGDRLTVTPNNVGYQIKATSYVGTISVPGFVLHIDPKVPVWNLLYLLTWSTHRLQVNPQDVARAGGDLTTALTVLYTQMLERVLVLGVDRAYVEETDRLVSLRGRIDWPTQSRSAGLPTPLACRYDDWSVDTPPNRLVKAASQVLLRQPSVPFATAHALKRLVALLNEAGPLRSSDLINDLHLTRLNAHYDEVTRLARAILTFAGLAHGPGLTPSPAFLINMNDVFEDFVHASLSHVLQGKVEVSRHRVVPLGSKHEVPGEPDLILTDPSGRDALVADAKYKLTRDGRGRSSDYYQLHAYCTSLHLARGVLIYCDADGDLPPRAVEVRNQRDLLETFRLSLSGDPENIASEVRRLANFLVPTRAATSYPASSLRVG